MNITLTETQRYAVNLGKKIIHEYGFVYYTMEQRTGKTFTAFATCEELGHRSILFIGKKKNINDIKDQAQAFPELKVKVINYESVHTISDLEQFDVVIIDEAHNLGTYPKPSLRWQKVRAKTQGRRMIFLSGTPTPESWSTIFYQLRLSDSCPFREENFYRWADKYVNVKKMERRGRPVNDYSGAKIKEIQKVIAKYQVVVSQSEAGFKTVIEEEVLPVRMSGYTKLAYDLMMKNTFIIFKRNDVAVMADEAAALLQKCHQIASGTLKNLKDYYIMDRSKAQAIKKDAMLKGLNKFAIYYKYIAEGRMLTETFGDLVFTDDMKFNAAERGVFVSQVQSGREGVNLSTCDVIYMFNIDFAWLSYSQTKDRVQHKDRTVTPKLIWVFGDCGIEAKIYEQVMKKKNFTTRHFRGIR
ncbi:MAG TPA: DEAD/DEAH box helicase family protein [bacterium]|nr:DEAD/DEAH box helicase family protein [bacterium]